MENIPSLIPIVVIIGAICLTLVRKSRNRKAAQSGADKELVRRAVRPLPDGMEDSQIAYAHWEEQESYGRSVTTIYYRCAVAFRDQTLSVFPLQIDKKTHSIQAGHPVTLTPENLGKVTVNRKQKNGAISRADVTLYDKQGETIVRIYVDAENLRKTRWYPVNILQQEELEAFERFITPLAGQVAAENPDVEAMMAASSKEGLGIIGAVLSAIGGTSGICFPPVGIVLCLVGLLLSVVGKLRGGKSKIPLIISVLCAVWIAVFCWIYIKYLFV